MSRIAVIDDDQSMCEMLEVGLGRRGFDVVWWTDAVSAEEALREDGYDAVVVDMQMPGENGLAFCRRLKDSRPDIPVIMITAFGSMEAAVSAIRAGAYDFVSKPFDLDVLAIHLERAANHRRLLEQVRLLSETISGPTDFDGLSGASPVMRKVYDKMRRVAGLDSSVLITGESGTGKEVVARSLHRNSTRHSAPFLAVDCSAIPGELMESELFGHRKGAFTGAHTDRKGLFLEAHGGTLFLDEIAELPLSLQPKLLRAIEDRTVRPIGSSQSVPFDVRIVTATNQDLESMVSSGQFRKDLYYRLNVIPIELPPLRSRGNDILILAERFLREFAATTGKNVTGLTMPAIKKLLAYSWPGNVRELRNAIEHAVVLTRYDKLIVEDFPSSISDHTESRLVALSDDPAELVTLDELELRYIRHVLKIVNGNKTAAARILGLDRKTLYRKLSATADEPDARPED